MLQSLLVERVEDGMPGPVCSRAGPLGSAFTVVRRHAAERALVDTAVLGARKWHAEVLEFDD